MKHVRIADFLLEDEISKAISMWRMSRENYARRVHDELIAPNLVRIQQRLGR